MRIYEPNGIELSIGQWQKQTNIPGQDCEIICGLLDSILDKLDDFGGDKADAHSGYALDTTPRSVFYFYHDCTRYWKYIRPVRKL